MVVTIIIDASRMPRKVFPSAALVVVAGALFRSLASGQVLFWRDIHALFFVYRLFVRKPKCPFCREAWDVTVDDQNKALFDERACPHCGAML